MPFNPYLSWRSSLAGMIGLLLWSLGAVPTGLSAEALPQSATAPPNNQTRQVDALLQRAEADQALGQYRNALAALRTAQSLAESLADPARHACRLSPGPDARSAAAAPLTIAAMK